MPAASEPKETGRDKDLPRMEALIASSATNSNCRVLGWQGREAAHGLRVSAREQQERQGQTELAAYGGLDRIVSNKQHLQGMRVGGEWCTMTAKEQQRGQRHGMEALQASSATSSTCMAYGETGKVRKDTSWACRTKRQEDKTGGDRSWLRMETL